MPAHLQEAFRFTQGQYLVMRTQLGNEEVRRSYSICSAVQDGELRVAVKRVPGGRFSSFANDVLKAGQQLEVMPPSGSFFVPLGVGAHLRHWGIAPERIVELDWDGEGAVGELRIVCTPARHFSGRFLTRNTTLWSSWAMIGPRHRAFFGGDTGYTGSFADIGEAHGPFDLTLMPVGAYHPGWPDIHMNPEEAVRAHLDVTDAGRGVFVPIHWATFRLAPHPWSEPVERLLAAARPAGVTVVVPMPGAQVRPGSVDLEDDWWQL